jgi:hypothetical protein
MICNYKVPHLNFGQFISCPQWNFPLFSLIPVDWWQGSLSKKALSTTFQNPTAHNSLIIFQFHYMLYKTCSWNIINIMRINLLTLFSCSLLTVISAETICIFLNMTAVSLSQWPSKKRLREKMMCLHIRSISSGIRTERRENKYIFIFIWVFTGVVPMKLKWAFLSLVWMDYVHEYQHTVSICCNEPVLLHSSWWALGAYLPAAQWISFIWKIHVYFTYRKTLPCTAVNI